MRLRPLLVTVAAAAAGIAAMARRSFGPASTPGVAPRGGAATPMPLPRSRPRSAVGSSVAATLQEVTRSGGSAARGRGDSVRLDLDRARAQHVEPVVEFLTFVQQQRGEGSHLLFVRYDDLDALAAAEGQDVEQFLARLDQLGVVVSTN